MASVCSFQTSYAHTSASPALARCAANRLPTAPQPTMQILIWGLYVSDSLLNCSQFAVFPAQQKTSTEPGRGIPLRSCPLDKCPAYRDRPYPHDRLPGGEARRSCSLRAALRSWRQSQGTQASSCRWNALTDVRARNHVSKTSLPQLDERCSRVPRRAFACVLPPEPEGTHRPFFVWSRSVCLRAEDARTPPSTPLSP